MRDPLIVSWSGGIDPAVQGQIRTQFHHVIDLAPTILEAAGIDHKREYHVGARPIPLVNPGIKPVSELIA